MIDDKITHDPVTWKLYYTLICTIAVNFVWPWTLHAVATLTTMLFCYFTFNYFKNMASEASEKRPWIKKFLHKDKKTSQ